MAGLSNEAVPMNTFLEKSPDNYVVRPKHKAIVIKHLLGLANRLRILKNHLFAQAKQNEDLSDLLWEALFQYEAAQAEMTVGFHTGMIFSSNLDDVLALPCSGISTQPYLRSLCRKSICRESFVSDSGHKDWMSALSLLFWVFLTRCRRKIPDVLPLRKGAMKLSGERTEKDE